MEKRITKTVEYKKAWENILSRLWDELKIALHEELRRKEHTWWAS